MNVGIALGTTEGADDGDEVSGEFVGTDVG